MIGKEAGEECNDLTLHTIESLRQLSSEMAEEFEKTLAEESGHLGIISDRARDLMLMFEKDADEFGGQINENIDKLEDFRIHFREV